MTASRLQLVVGLDQGSCKLDPQLLVELSGKRNPADGMLLNLGQDTKGTALRKQLSGLVWRVFKKGKVLRDCSVDRNPQRVPIDTVLLHGLLPAGVTPVPLVLASLSVEYPVLLLLLGSMVQMATRQQVVGEIHECTILIRNVHTLAPLIVLGAGTRNVRRGNDVRTA